MLASLARSAGALRWRAPLARSAALAQSLAPKVMGQLKVFVQFSKFSKSLLELAMISVIPSQEIELWFGSDITEWMPGNQFNNYEPSKIIKVCLNGWLFGETLILKRI